MFSEFMSRAAGKSDWVKWLLSAKEAQSTFDLLATSSANLTPQERSKWAKSMRSNRDQVEASIHELLVIELLRRLGRSPQYAPSHDGQTPDLQFSVDGQTYIGDVFVSHSPSNSVVIRRGEAIKEEVIESHDAGERARKIEDRLNEKISKYRQINLPLVLFVFVGDHNLLSIEHIQEAVLGHYWSENRFTKAELVAAQSGGRSAPTGLFLRKLVEIADPGPQLSAVVACDWFDSLNRQEPGKRLACLVIPYWDAIHKLPIRALGSFPQIEWCKTGPDIWEWHYLYVNVARLPSSLDIEWAIYTANDPW